MEAMKLIGRVALVTGASSGIGRATAVQFAQLGAELALTGRDLPALEETTRLCSDVAPDSQVLLTVADLTKTADLQFVMSQTLEKFTRLDILVNCAGVIAFDNIDNFDENKFQSVMDINVNSVVQLTHLATPHLIRSKGAIVNVSSLLGIRSVSGLTTYCMSKASIDQFTKCTALDLAPKGVRVNSVNPASVVTNIQRRAGVSEEKYAAFLERCKIIYPLGRVGQPEEVARAIAFLASDAASFITGVLLPLDGGYQLLCPR